MNKKTIIFFVFIWMALSSTVHADNPVIKDRFSADPATLVHDGKVYLYTGHDEAPVTEDFFVLREWNVFSSSDLENWELEGSLPRSTFKWAIHDSAWASQAIERDGQFYWYVTVFNGDPDDPGYAIGVAQSDHPIEGFEDAIGKPLVSPNMTKNPENMGAEPWDNIDPTVFIDDNGQAYLYWGNTHLYYAKLKDNMIELEGEIQQIEINNLTGTFTEGPWLHKYKEKYYLTFAMNYPEEIGYAMSSHPEGPWEYKGKIMNALPGSSTSHPAIFEWNNEWVFVYHTAALPTGGEFRRSVSMEKMSYNADGTIQEIIPTASGLRETSYRLEAYGNKNLFIQHKGMGIKAGLIKEDYLNGKWYPVSGLIDGNENSISFQPENKPGFYLKRKGEKVIVAKHDGTEEFKKDATFNVTEGLADKTWESYQLYDSDFYLSLNQDNTLILTDRSSIKNKELSTFRLLDDDGVQINQTSKKDIKNHLNLSNEKLIIGIALFLLVVGFFSKKRRNQGS